MGHVREENYIQVLVGESMGKSPLARHRHG
jgi:hypothetical protein